MRGVDSNPEYELAAGAPGLFGCYLRNRLALSFESGQPWDLRAIALQAADDGSPDLAEEAEIVLTQHFGVRAGETSETEAVVGPITWTTESDPGRGTFLWEGRVGHAGLPRPPYP